MDKTTSCLNQADVLTTQLNEDIHTEAIGNVLNSARQVSRKRFRVFRRNPNIIL